MIQIQSLWEAENPTDKVRNFQYVRAITIEYLIVFLSNNTFTVNFRSLVDESTQTIVFDFFKDKTLSDIKLNELGTHFYLLTEDGLFANIPIFIFSEEAIVSSWETLVQAEDPVKFLQGLQGTKEHKKKFSFAGFSEFIFGKGEEQKVKKPFTFTLEDITMLNIRSLITEVFIYEHLNENLSFRERIDVSDEVVIGSFQTFEKWIDIYEEEYQVFMAKGGYIIFFKESNSQIKVFQYPFEIALFKIIKSQKASSMLVQDFSGVSYVVILEQIAENRVDFIFDKYLYSNFEPQRVSGLNKSSLYFDQANIREDTKFIQYRPDVNLIQIYTEGHTSMPSENIQCHMDSPSHLIEWLQFFLAFYIHEDELEVKLLSKKILRNQIRQGLYKNGNSPSSRKSCARILKYLHPPFQDLESACIVVEKINFGKKITTLKLDQSNLVRNQTQGSYDLSLILATVDSLCSITISLKSILESNWTLLSQSTITKDRFLMIDYVLCDFYSDYHDKLAALKDSLKKSESYNVLFDVHAYELVSFKEKQCKIPELRTLLNLFLCYKHTHMRANIIQLIIERMLFDEETSLDTVMEYAMLIFFAIFRDVVSSEYSTYYTLSFRASLSEELKGFLADLTGEGNKLDAIKLSMKIIFRIVELAQEKCINIKKGYFNNYLDNDNDANFQLYFEKVSLNYTLMESTITPYKNFPLWLAKSVDAKQNYLTPCFRALLKLCEEDFAMSSWSSTSELIRELDYDQTVNLLYNAIYKAKVLSHRSIHDFFSHLERAFECLIASRNVKQKELEIALELFSFYHALSTMSALGEDLGSKQSLSAKVQNKLLKFADSASRNEIKCDYIGITYTVAVFLHLHTLLSNSKQQEELTALETTLGKFLVGVQHESESIDIEKLMYFCVIEENETAAILIVDSIQTPCS